MNQQRFWKKENKEIHLDLYVDESKGRVYINGTKKEIIDYIMILAVPKDKKDVLLRKLINARCLSGNSYSNGYCKDECKYHENNNNEIHYTEIGRDKIRKMISEKWIDILLDNGLKGENSIYFNIFGIIENNIDKSLFGKEKVYGNIYARFFRTALIRVIKMFNGYDKIIIDNIYHDKTSEMEQHNYFKTNAIKRIRLNELELGNNKVEFTTDEITFIDSSHKISKSPDSQLIQFVDLILGLSCNAIHDDATNKNKIELTYRILPLISRILDKRKNRNKNSKYNYFNKQVFTFFPKLSKSQLKEKCEMAYGAHVNFEVLLEDANLFENSKEILFGKEKEDTLFDLLENIDNNR